MAACKPSASRPRPLGLALGPERGQRVLAASAAVMVVSAKPMCTRIQSPGPGRSSSRPTLTVRGTPPTSAMTRSVWPVSPATS